MRVFSPFSIRMACESLNRSAITPYFISKAFVSSSRSGEWWGDTMIFVIPNPLRSFKPISFLSGSTSPAMAMDGLGERSYLGSVMASQARDWDERQ